MHNSIKTIATSVKALIIVAIMSWLMSCSSTKNIVYFQDADQLNGMALQSTKMFRLRPGDKINIVVNSSNSMLSEQFTLTTRTNPQYTLGGTTIPRTAAGRSNNLNQLIAYTVDKQGSINFPLLGNIMVEGRTREELAEYIQDRLKERELVTDAVVTVEFVNLGVDVLGEVNKPGHIEITKDQFTIIDAISQAGDLTINGKRNKVIVNRQADGTNEVYTIDLTDMQSTLLSPAYYLQQNDMVYVMPNKKRSRESKAAGNTFSSPGFWISVASLITTITALILK